MKPPRSTESARQRPYIPRAAKVRPAVEPPPTEENLGPKRRKSSATRTVKVADKEKDVDMDDATSAKAPPKKKTVGKARAKEISAAAQRNKKARSEAAKNDERGQDTIMGGSEDEDSDVSVDSVIANDDDPMDDGDELPAQAALNRSEPHDHAQAVVAPEGTTTVEEHGSQEETWNRFLEDTGVLADSDESTEMEDAEGPAQNLTMSTTEETTVSRDSTDEAASIAAQQAIDDSIEHDDAQAQKETEVAVEKVPDNHSEPSQAEGKENIGTSKPLEYTPPEAQEITEPEEPEHARFTSAEPSEKTKALPETCTVEEPTEVRAEGQVSQAQAEAGAAELSPTDPKTNLPVETMQLPEDIALSTTSTGGATPPKRMAAKEPKRVASKQSRQTRATVEETLGSPKIQDGLQKLVDESKRDTTAKESTGFANLPRAHGNVKKMVVDELDHIRQRVPDAATEDADCPDTQSEDSTGEDPNTVLEANQRKYVQTTKGATNFKSSPLPAPKPRGILKKVKKEVKFGQFSRYRTIKVPVEGGNEKDFTKDSTVPTKTKSVQSTLAAPMQGHIETEKPGERTAEGEIGVGCPVRDLGNPVSVEVVRTFANGESFYNKYDSAGIAAQDLPRYTAADNCASSTMKSPVQEVAILVGPKKKKFCMSVQSMQSSGVVRRQLAANEDHRYLELPTASPRSFQDYMYWKRSAYCLLDVEEEEWPPSRLFDMYYLGVLLDDVTFRDIIVHTMCVEYSEDWTWELIGPWCKKIFSITTDKHAGRNFFLDVIARIDGINDILNSLDEKDYGPEFVKALHRSKYMKYGDFEGVYWPVLEDTIDIVDQPAAFDGNNKVVCQAYHDHARHGMPLCAYMTSLKRQQRKQPELDEDDLTYVYKLQDSDLIGENSEEEVEDSTMIEEDSTLLEEESEEGSSIIEEENGEDSTLLEEESEEESSMIEEESGEDSTLLEEESEEESSMIEEESGEDSTMIDEETEEEL
ncbi:hypothetical protein K490DRAFT_69186 [Saccharata proteae CBS 121410]|uniref:Uncharacterized protein n=1 Tax=Saccharata proteae CBS 121410 TaxID=1314787 RepID=A0A9P4HP20_9PEZI|nr:hypothetical protein K490DRAFT_69186 [Saccharata proteae CBS 121410]